MPIEGGWHSDRWHPKRKAPLLYATRGVVLNLVQPLAAVRQFCRFDRKARRDDMQSPIKGHICYLGLFIVPAMTAHTRLVASPGRCRSAILAAGTFSLAQLSDYLFSSSHGGNFWSSIRSACSASAIQSSANRSNRRFVDSSFVCAARFFASAALCRYSSDRDDM
jgi:hypothetical protein